MVLWRYQYDVLVSLNLGLAITPEGLPMGVHRLILLILYVNYIRALGLSPWAVHLAIGTDKKAGDFSPAPGQVLQC